MITEDNKLQIFENFIVDTNLPKHKTKKSNTNNTISGFNVTDSGIQFFSDSMPNSGNVDKLTIKDRIYNLALRASKIFKRETKTEDTIINFFVSISSSIGELHTTAKLGSIYKDAINDANNLGQTALVEKLVNLRDVYRSESKLISMKLDKIVTEENIVKFYNLANKNRKLKLTWIKNYVRLIPKPAIEIKNKTDEKLIFDNYVILHYDALENSVELTSKEKEAAKDPILFGVLKDSRKLYYLADWKDEVCDLTLDVLFNTIGEKALNINEDTFRSAILENVNEKYEHE